MEILFTFLSCEPTYYMDCDFTVPYTSILDLEQRYDGCRIHFVFGGSAIAIESCESLSSGIKPQ